VLAFFTAHLAPDLAGVIVYPNPYRPNDQDPTNGSPGEGITFDGLPSEVQLQLFTVSGRLVRDDALPLTGQWIWDTTDQQGIEVASGVYFWRLQHKGQSTLGKIAVIR